MNEIDFTSCHLTPHEMTGIFESTINRVLGPHIELSEGAIQHPFGECIIIDFFERAIGASLVDSTEDGRDLRVYLSKLNVTVEPNSIHQAIDAYRENMGGRHPLTQLLPDLEKDPLTVLSKYVAITGDLEFVADNRYVMVLIRPPQLSSLSERLAYISCLPKDLLGEIKGCSIQEFDNYVLLKRLAQRAHHICDGVIASRSAYPWQGYTDYSGLRDAREYFVERYPNSRAPALYQAAVLVGSFMQRRAPYEIVGFYKPRDVRKGFEGIADKAFSTPRHLPHDRMESDERIRMKMSYMGNPTAHAKPDVLAEGLFIALDEQVNAMRRDFSAVYSYLYHFYALGHRISPPAEISEALKDGDHERFIGMFLKSQTLEGLRLLTGDKFLSLVPGRGSQMNSLKRALRLPFN